MGKGSHRRPPLVQRDTLEANWERTFGRFSPSPCQHKRLVPAEYRGEYKCQDCGRVVIQ